MDSTSSPTLEALCAQAAARHREGALDEAEPLYLAVLERDPRHVVARHLLGALRHQQGRNAEALILIEAALADRPAYPEALANLGTVLKALGRLEEALAAYDRALAARADAIAWNGRGAALMEMNRLHEALAAFEEALRLAPGCAPALANRGRVREYLGRLEDARQDYRDALTHDPGLSNVYLDYADLTKMTVGDPLLAAMTRRRQDEAALDDTARIQLDFALAKAHADLKDHDTGFRYLLRANALKRRHAPYDEDAVTAFFDRIEAVMDTGLLREKEKLGGGDPSSAPIFILGMMRSGSTLVEQILASHPDVHGAGELSALSDIAGSACGAGGAAIPYPDFIPALDAAGLREIGATYLRALPQVPPGVRHVTDKMPSNFFLAGLIHLALPQARIIHTMRDPLDTCVSCFSKLFTADQPHTYDLAELGRYHRRYQKLMAHWHRVLPPGRILDVRYEDVVADLEGQARRLLAHCGLSWDPRCLDFHAHDRPVRTASVSQVRQPLYGEARGRARAYDTFLAPLRQALEMP